MKILLLGSNGLLGKTLFFFLKEKKIKLILLKKFNNRKKIKNIKDFKYIENIIINKKPDILINCIVQKNEKLKSISKSKYFLINSKLPRFLSKICQLNKVYFIHISTDSVFSGNKGNYIEKDFKDPKDEYSLSKKKGEVRNKFTTTIRTSFVGPEYNSTKALFSWFLNQNKQVKGFSNYYFTGLTSLELSNIIYKYFIKKNKFYNEVLNIGGKKISKYELLFKISKIFKKKIKIKKKNIPKINRTLNNSKFLKLSKYKVKNWETMLKNLKKFMKSNNYKY